MGDRRKHSRAMQMAQYQANLDIEDAEMINAEAEYSTDKYCRLVETSVIKNLKRFYKAIQAIYGATYLRKPNREDLKRLLRKLEKRRFPSMIRSLDYMHWEMKNCLTAWAGQFKGRHNKLIIVLEAVASYDTWIWLAFFGAPRSNNDINILKSSSRACCNFKT
ncbi:uncharacterized protein [Malus domestica]|uniref:uncharacterized protein n=1 Tax=Malus domestica TaxID=3750 RepID=UPI003975166A